MNSDTANASYLSLLVLKVCEFAQREVCYSLDAFSGEIHANHQQACSRGGEKF